MLNTEIKTPELVEDSEEKDKKHYGKTKKVMQYMEQGLTPQEAIKLATGKDNPHRNTISQVKKKYAKWSVMHPKRQKQVANAVDYLVNSFVSGEKKYAPQVVDLYKEQEDRRNPKVKQSLNLNLNADISPIDLSKYRMNE